MQHFVTPAIKKSSQNNAATCTGTSKIPTSQLYMQASGGASSEYMSLNVTIHNQYSSGETASSKFTGNW